MIERDKKLHFTVCAIISALTMILFFILKTPLFIACIASVLTSMGAGFGKEWGDKCAEHNHWDWYDIIADFVGCITGTILFSFLWL